MIKPTKICLICGNQYVRDTRSTWKHWNQQRFCSIKCIGIHKTRQAEANMEPIINYFMRYIEIANFDDCWEWQGIRDKDGYGLLNHNKKMHRAHRVSMSIAGMALAKTEFACHKCDNPSCVNPMHLFAARIEIMSMTACRKDATQRAKEAACQN